MVYCTYNMLNMFRALLCPSSGSRDYMCVITECGVQCNQALHTIGGNNTHIVSSSWWWAQNCPKHVERITSAINDSVASN